MATATPTAPLLPEAQEPETVVPDPAAGQALVAVHGPVSGGGILSQMPAAALLPVELDVSIEVREFRVRDLLALMPGRVIETSWSHGEDVPLGVGEVQLAWSEFEVLDGQLAVRITRLS